jgi:hypothetical protein
LAKLARPGGLGAVAAESLAIKHQLLIMKRAQRSAPKLTPWIDWRWEFVRFSCDPNV